MPPKDKPGGKGHPAAQNASNKKRKDPPSSSAPTKPRFPHKRPKLDARTILTEKPDQALSNGELDLHAFLKARQFEIKALQDGMARAKGALSSRAFQQVPREMRRRAASHHVKRVPKRLQKRAAREMKDDNTPTVNRGKRKLEGSRARIRSETALRLGRLAGKKKEGKGIAKGGEVETTKKNVVGRTPIPKLKRGVLAQPQKAKSKFRKRQVHKTWLPTHLWHAKRARMTEPSKPLWRFALPLTPTQKSYRPTHVAGGKRGTMCWDKSWESTIGLEGTQACLEKVLKSVGVTQDEAWGKRGGKWRDGKRSWSGWVSKDYDGDFRAIAPVTIICCGDDSQTQTDAGNVEENVGMEGIEATKESKKSKPLRRRLLIRVHPSAFLELWEVLLKAAKMQRPVVHAEDLRFEIGTIELTGPGSTEALLGILHPTETGDPLGQRHAELFKSLAGLTNPASLPPSSLLTFSAMDPRLHHPPRKINLPNPANETAALELLRLTSEWPADTSTPSPFFFDRTARHLATRLPSQKALNRRKGASAPGSYPPSLPTDPPIPILLYTTRATPTSSSSQGTWTLLAPWKCILPLWQSLVYYPLSTGGNPRFGGLEEMQQIAMEQQVPWFPRDFPGTRAGWAWEVEGRERRRQEWERRPRGKRLAYESLDLGAGRKGEVGVAWGCDFERLLGIQAPDEKGGDGEIVETPTPFPPVQQISGKVFESILARTLTDFSTTAVATVRITLLSGGTPKPCARIYRLPLDSSLSASETTSPAAPVPPPPSTIITTTTSKPSTPSLPPDLRAQWLALLPPSTTTTSKSSRKTANARPNRPTSPRSRKRLLAQELLQPPQPYPPEKAASPHPLVPGEEDLVGFVTAGNFCLSAGRGRGMGVMLVGRVLRGRKGEKEKGERLCVVRNVGEGVGRLGRWDVV